jgi:hypothetical protein
MGARNPVGTGLSYRPAGLHTQAGEIDLLELILGLLKSFKIRTPYDLGVHGQMFVQYVEPELPLVEESELLLVE